MEFRKDNMSEYCKNCYELQEQLQQLKAANEELQKTNDTLTVTRGKLLGDLWIEEESLKDYVEHYNKAIDELDQLKQTLAEIEEFCIVYSSNHDAYENVYKHILEIINEAKDGE